jgi:formate--tetrahydrofolate ligase
VKVRSSISTVPERGGEGGIDLAREVLAALAERQADFKPLYPDSLSIVEKLTTIAREIYGADGVEFVETAAADIERLTREGFAHLPINMAKTQLSFTDDPKVKGAPKGWRLKVRELHVAAGARFLVAMTGKILTMPGLPKEPLAERLDVTPEGRILGLF